MAPRLRRVEVAVDRARAHLLGLQNHDGYWVGELEADVSVSAGYVPLMYYMLGRVDPVRQRKVVNFVRSKQNEDGSWSSHAGGPGDLNVSIQSYFDLKLAGVSGEEPFMRRGRDFILSKGGICRSSVFTKIWLALFGQYPWEGTPSLPPEVILLPNWFYINIYEFASWSRATIVALSVVLTNRPTCPVPDGIGVPELYLEPEGRRDYSLGKIRNPLSWKSFFLVADRLLKLWERSPLKPGRRLALQRTEEWIVGHQEADGSWGGIMLPWVYSLVALKSLGYPLDHPVMERGMKGLEGFIVEDDATLRLQPATSPVWDTAWSVLALRESGLPDDHPALTRAASWLLSQQVTVGGDWQVKNPRTEPAAWAFEFENDQYPDMDDTAVVARALGRVRLPAGDEAAKERAIGKAVRWIADMQSKDGGWAAFDKDNDRRILSQIPFADFMSPLDPTCADVTAHVVELLGESKLDPASLGRALAYLRRTQEADGSWYGRWGVNYLYGTGLVLAALAAANQDPEDGYVQRACNWLAFRQNPDGGWGESCESYSDLSWKGSGPSTASQTAWALMGLMAGGRAFSPEVERGVDYLLRSQREDGSWDEAPYTGTGFPRAFYLRYDLYRAYFPLMALARYRVFLKGVLR
jgi:squalene-hopene/tetraprenyl-beta-curcumene cyclase